MKKISEEEARVRTETDDVMKTWKIGENYKNIDKINEETQKIMRTFNCKVSTVYEELCDFKNAKLEELKDMSTKKEKVSKALSDIIKARKNESNLKELNRLLLNIFYKTKQIYKNLTTIKGQLDAKLKEFGKAGDDAIKSINSFVTAMFAPSEERLNYIIDWKEQAGVNKTGALASEMMRNEDLELVVLHRLEMMLRGHSHCNTTVKMLNESLSKLEGLREYQAKNAKPRSEKAAEGVMEEEEEEEGEHIEEGDGGDNNA